MKFEFIAAGAAIGSWLLISCESSPKSHADSPGLSPAIAAHDAPAPSPAGAGGWLVKTSIVLVVDGARVELPPLVGPLDRSGVIEIARTGLATNGRQAQRESAAAPASPLDEMTRTIDWRVEVVPGLDGGLLNLRGVVSCAEREGEVLEVRRAAVGAEQATLPLALSPVEERTTIRQSGMVPGRRYGMEIAHPGGKARMEILCELVPRP